MMKCVGLLVLTVLLTGCSEESKSWLLGKDRGVVGKYKPFLERKTENYYITCIDGVEYWTQLSGHNTWFAPRFDKNTKQIVLCSGDGISEDQK